MGTTSLPNIKSGAGWQWLLLDCRVKDSIQGVFLTDTGMTLHRVATLAVSSLTSTRRQGSKSAGFGACVGSGIATVIHVRMTIN